MQKKKMYLVEVQETSEEEQKDEEELNKGDEVTDDVNPQIFVHAINGIALRGYMTIRVKVHVNKR